MRLRVRLAGVGLAVSGVVVAGRAAGATATIAIGAGLMLGARVPVILNSRSDSPMSRLASCAVAALTEPLVAELLEAQAVDP